jgi:hypothetical protein
VAGPAREPIGLAVVPDAWRPPSRSEPCFEFEVVEDVSGVGELFPRRRKVQRLAGTLFHRGCLTCISESQT